MEINGQNRLITRRYKCLKCSYVITSWWLSVAQRLASVTNVFRVQAAAVVTSPRMGDHTRVLSDKSLPRVYTCSVPTVLSSTVKKTANITVQFDP